MKIRTLLLATALALTPLVAQAGDDVIDMLRIEPGTAIDTCSVGRGRESPFSAGPPAHDSPKAPRRSR